MTGKKIAKLAMTLILLGSILLASEWATDKAKSAAKRMAGL